MGSKIETGGTGRWTVDYHIHTWFSDGRISPTEIVKQAKALGYEEIAITDHDGMDGIAEALQAGQTYRLSVIPGVELAVETEVKKLGLHILGYGMDPDHPKLVQLMEDLREKRARRNEKLLAVLEQMGFPLTSEDLQRENKSHYIGKPVIARAMAARGYIEEYREAFVDGKFLESPEAKAVKREKIPAEAAVALIRRCGGAAVLAHPIQIKGIGEKGSSVFYENLEKLILHLKEAGLYGMECYHPDHNQAQEAAFTKLAEKHGLRVTRGSDFHGDRFV